MRTRKSPAGWSDIEGQIKDEGALVAGRQKLADAALRCFVKHGYSNTSVNDIADAAGVSVGSVYKYVRAKEDVLWLVSEAALERTADALDDAFDRAAGPADRLRAVVDAAIRQADADRDLIRLVYVEFRHMPKQSQQRFREQETKIVSRLRELIEEGIAAGVFVCANPLEAAVTIDMFSSTWVLKPYLLRGVSLSDYVVIQQTAALMLVGATGQPNGKRRK